MTLLMSPWRKHCTSDWCILWSHFQFSFPISISCFSISPYIASKMFCTGIPPSLSSQILTVPLLVRSCLTGRTVREQSVPCACPWGLFLWTGQLRKEVSSFHKFASMMLPHGVVQQHPSMISLKQTCEKSWPLLWAGRSTEGCFRGRHTGQSDFWQFFQWDMIWWEEAQWGSGRRERGGGWREEKEEYLYRIYIIVSTSNMLY